jgi:hypothetical protein
MYISHKFVFVLQCLDQHINEYLCCGTDTIWSGCTIWMKYREHSFLIRLSQNDARMFSLVGDAIVDIGVCNRLCKLCYWHKKGFPALSITHGFASTCCPRVQSRGRCYIVDIRVCRDWQCEHVPRRDIRSPGIDELASENTGLFVICTIM